MATTFTKTFTTKTWRSESLQYGRRRGMKSLSLEERIIWFYDEQQVHHRVPISHPRLSCLDLAALSYHYAKFNMFLTTAIIFWQHRGAFTDRLFSVCVSSTPKKIHSCWFVFFYRLPNTLFSACLKFFDASIQYITYVTRVRRRQENADR